VNALWINGLAVVARLQERLGRDAARTRAVEAAARASFVARYGRSAGDSRGGLLDVADGHRDQGRMLRPNQLLAVSLPYAPLRHDAGAAAGIVRACAPLVTSVGIRSLAPDDPAYLGRHRGGPAQRDRAYHQGTVWPWLIGPYVDAVLRSGAGVGGVLDGLEGHLSEWGLGSVS